MARMVRGVPIPTGKEVSYSGRIFVSGLEARWALLLDLLGVNWDFEPSHYQLADKLWYKPDFYLPELHIWLEVKGVPFFRRSDALRKAVLSVAGQNPLPQREHPYEESRFVLIGGEVKPPKDGCTPMHTMLIRTKDPNVAATAHTIFARTDEGWMLQRVTDAIMHFDARKVTRSHATDEVGNHLLKPPQARQPPDPIVDFAYRTAARIPIVNNRFDVTKHRDAAELMIRRRAGRPLPPRSWPKNYSKI
ncbi:hypothetical protein [Nesterenkonia rhizosphaerae]|uniref:TnsA endonuclease N-terminal domain-containing protein n=1 Tax=Nesterenkonia rhizosphaerae TaxID=1348272 RepID=A0ABP9G0M3_9MICC